MLNISYGRNKKLLDACKPLKEYSWFVDEIRKNRADMDIEHAVDKAINNMPEDFQIKPFLKTHRSEVQGMLLTEYNEVETMELFREEGREEGRAEERMNTERSETGLIRQKPNWRNIVQNTENCDEHAFRRLIVT